VPGQLRRAEVLLAAALLQKAALEEVLALERKRTR